MMEDARVYASQLVGMGEPYESARTRITEAIDVLMGDDELPVGDEALVRAGDETYTKALRLMVENHDAKALQVLEAAPGFERISPSHRLLFAYLLYRNNWRYRSREMVETLLLNRDYRSTHPELTFYGARIHWLADENQTAARLALEYVDRRRETRQQHATDVMKEQ